MPLALQNIHQKFDYSGDELAIFVVAYYHLALFSILAAPPASVSKAHKAKSAVPKDDDAAILRQEIWSVALFAG